MLYLIISRMQGVVLFDFKHKCKLSLSKQMGLIRL